MTTLLIHNGIPHAYMEVSKLGTMPIHGPYYLLFLAVREGVSKLPIEGSSGDAEDGDASFQRIHV